MAYWGGDGIQQQGGGAYQRGSGGGAGAGAGSGGLLSHLKYLDAFPKQREEAAEFFQRTTSGGVITLVSAAFMVLLFFSELRERRFQDSIRLRCLFTRVTTTHELSVDTTRGEQMEIHFDVTFPRMPCAWISIDAMDVSGELHLDVQDHDVYKKRLTPDGYPITDGVKHEVGPSRKPLPKDAIPVGKAGPARHLLQQAEQQQAAAAAEQVGQQQQQQQQQAAKPDDDAAAAGQQGGGHAAQGQEQQQQQQHAATAQDAGATGATAGGDAKGGAAAAGGGAKPASVMCLSCYGAEAHAGDCCNTCDEVREAYRRKGWALLDYEQVEQCHSEGFLTEINEQGGEGCHIWGKLLINKVAGNFHFAPGRSYQQGNMHIHDLSPFKQGQAFDFSHTVNKLAFGQEFPGMRNPLDGVEAEQNPSVAARGSSGVYQARAGATEGERSRTGGLRWSTVACRLAAYFLKVVPTRYAYLSNSTVATNQFSVTEHFIEANPHSSGSLPGLFFFYELSPIKVSFQESRLSLLAFLTSVCAIVGGVFTVSGIVDATIYHGGRALKRKMELGKLSTLFTGDICLMTTNSINVCAYSWAAAAIGIVAAVALVVAALAGSRAGAASVSLFLAVWYLALAITINVYSNKADNHTFTTSAGLELRLPLPQHKYRRDCYALAYTSFACSLKEEEAGYRAHGASAAPPPAGAYHTYAPKPDEASSSLPPV
eukprot:scaffold10.g2342.t1